MTLSCSLLCLSRSLMPPNGIQRLKRMILVFWTCHITFCRENCFVIAGRVGNSIYLNRFIQMFLHENKNITNSFFTYVNNKITNIIVVLLLLENVSFDIIIIPLSSRDSRQVKSYIKSYACLFSIEEFL